MSKDQVLEHNRINVDMGTTVTMSLAAYTYMREAHDRAERYAKQIDENNVNLAAKDLRIKELEDSLEAIQQQSIAQAAAAGTSTLKKSVPKKKK